MDTSFKIHIVFSILSRNPKICYFLNKILLSDLTLLYRLLYLCIRISCKENATLLLLDSVSIEECVFTYHYKYFIGTFHFQRMKHYSQTSIRQTLLGPLKSGHPRKIVVF